MTPSRHRDGAAGVGVESGMKDAGHACDAGGVTSADRMGDGSSARACVAAAQRRLR